MIMKSLNARTMGFSYGRCSHPLTQGTVGGGAVDSGAALELGGYWSGTLNLGGNRSCEVKRKEGFHISHPTAPAQSCLASSALICSPLLP